MARVLPGYREQAKERIITDSLPVFIEHGYHKTTMEEIARHLDISKGTLYLYFKNKEGLFREVVAALRARNREELLDLLQREDLPLTFGYIFDLVMRASEDYAAFAFELYAAAIHNKELGEILEEDVREDIMLSREFLDQLKEKGIVKPDIDTCITARGFNALFIGLFTMAQLGISRDEAKQTWEEMCRVWLVKD
ncbi:MAG TPA: TetR/AcrR family transcriptional regulator [Methanoregulaceae archaeon]|jgi:AcrR family transcriptional regulator|nr:TetR/AcrR family transcriptional regulator [Methanoregulaceae archaeon]MDD5048923.1 TetR/AcrR family transcriptional regulator [Methanoregulaceae archaeon]MDD5685869.1 TetR/AcrR family transcriptional regulator [Methanoregulaceae archaeon]HOP66475.1 TetR/AcrR family transcriptional regulator [Methanoregulaceae archaeon]HPJ73601.1 TetR/AcrR family transcriptional regulator [Methanoregulaceae archaeon]